jgi:hypothetical protein
MPGVTGSPISAYGYTTPSSVPTPRIRTSVGGLGVAATVLLAADALMALLSAGLLAWRRSLLGKVVHDSTAVDPDQLRNADQAARAALGWFIIFSAATIAVFICWFWAARNNAEAYSPNRGTLGVGWSVGGWFVPVATLVLPCIVARDIYRGTMAGRRRKPAGGGEITGWWWAVYVAFWLMGFVLIGESSRAKNAETREEHLTDLQAAATAGIVAVAVGAAAAVLAIVYVRTVTKTQKARNRDGDRYGGPGANMQADPYAMPYGYGAPTPGYPMPAQQPMPIQDIPVQDRIPFADPGIAETQTAETQTAETQAAEVQDAVPPQEPGDRLTPPG